MLSTTLETKYLSIADIIIPDIADNHILRSAFIQNFNIFFGSLDSESASKIKLLIKVLSILAVIYTFKKIEKLSIEQRELFLEKIQHFPIAKIVGGFTGLRSLTFMSFYSMKESWESINYSHTSSFKN